MAQGVINVRIDEEAKKKFSLFCDETGLSMSSVISMFIARVNNDWCIPFEIRGKDPFYSKENMARLRKSIAQVEAHQTKVHDLTPYRETLKND